MKILTTYLSLLEIGQRTNQEDSIYPAIGQSIPHNDLFILCDGMGGHDCGEVASQAVCQTMSSYILAHPNTDFESALEVAYDALDANDNDSDKKMGTTLAFLKFDEGQCVVAHIGDSRVYQIRPSERRIIYVTRDHSLVNDLIACGELTPEEAKHSSQKNVITRAMQPHQERRTKADVAILTDIQEGDYFYMCSDGMLEISEDEDIVNVLSMDKSDEQKLDILKRVTRDNKDNHSCHLIHVTAINGRTTSPLKDKPKRVDHSKLFYCLIALVLVVALGVFVAKHFKSPKGPAPVLIEPTEVTTSEHPARNDIKSIPEAPPLPSLPDISSENTGL